MKKNIATPTKTKEILNKYNINLKKKLGQNLLIDQNILNIIVNSANISSEDTVIEIGAGFGALTQKILEVLDHEGQLIAIEKDEKFIKILNDIFGEYENLVIINKDVRDINWDGLSKNYDNKIKILGNLPYYLTTPLIIDLLKTDCNNFSKMVFMVQKEVAERMAASPGNKSFGSLSVVVQFYCKPEIIHKVNPEVFIPKPDVYSSIITLTPYDEIPYKPKNKKFFFKVVKAIFQLRRKNIKNSLLQATVLDLDKEIIINGLEECGINKMVRGEKLSIEKMVELSNVLWEIKK